MGGKKGLKEIFWPCSTVDKCALEHIFSEYLFKDILACYSGNEAIKHAFSLFSLSGFTSSGIQYVQAIGKYYGNSKYITK